jgi:hypothetical protein
MSSGSARSPNADPGGAVANGACLAGPGPLDGRVPGETSSDEEMSNVYSGESGGWRCTTVLSRSPAPRLPLEDSHVLLSWP